MSESLERRITLVFIAFFLLRYTRTIVGIYTFLRYKPKPLNHPPKFRTDDVTVIIPTTFKRPGDFVKCLNSIVACHPLQIFVVTAFSNVELVNACVRLNSFDEVRVLGVERLNKRQQMIKALKKVRSEIVVFADDDVFWPDSDYLGYLLAIFEDSTVGAGGTRQRAKRSQKPSLWNFLGIAYLERRVWNNVTTNAIDGSISTLSGRTAAYRTEILKTEEFYDYFINDSWFGKQLNSDDDKCLTRYVYSRGWSIAIQFNSCSARSHWRGNFTVMFKESYWRSWKHWWGLYVIYLGQFQTPAAAVDGIMFFLLNFTVAGRPEYSKVANLAFGFWIFLTKILKLIPHFCRHPRDIMFIPASILFSYLHGIINIYAACTLNVTTWGTQNLDKLAQSRATDDSMVPLLRSAMSESDSSLESTPGRLTDGYDYFSVMPLVPME
ncbi:glycosyltransferase family 2 protein [Acrodontium crateriforme]|uniref:Glycosyltransferase family 2 protein n=1 Tax=Acrodontium crateriforme TaxID=150365 RepID=A0AAQ3RB73_9PEZI|nr:glycosyltransferase family 2 protein [Acrodontium crateriforme]